MEEVEEDMEEMKDMEEVKDMEVKVNIEKEVKVNMEESIENIKENMKEVNMAEKEVKEIPAKLQKLVKQVK